MFSGLKIALVFVVLAVAGGGFFYVKQLQSNLEIARLNNAKLEQAVETSEASIATLKADNARLNTLTDQLNSDLNKSEAYGDELRATLNKHNLTPFLCITVFTPTVVPWVKYEILEGEIS